MGREHIPAASLTSHHGFARDVLLLDDCQGTFNWTAAGTGGDDVHAYAAAAAFTRLKGMHLATRTTAAADNDYLSATRRLGLPESEVLRLQCRLNIPLMAKVAEVDVQLSINDGINLCCFAIRLMCLSGLVQREDTDGNWVTIPGITVNWSDAASVLLALDVSVRSMNYLALSLNGLRAALPPEGGYLEASAAGRGITLRYGIWASAAPPATVYITDTALLGSLDL